MRLTKQVPARTKTIREALEATKDFMVMSQRYREIRSSSRNPMDSCFWCQHKFEDGEWVEE